MKEKGKLIGSPQQAPLGYCDYSAIHKETPHYREDVCVNHTADPVAIPFSDAPCGHSSQYCYTSDGGKTIICLLCEHLEAESPRKPSAEQFIERLRKFSFSFQDGGSPAVYLDDAIRALEDMAHGQHPVPAPETQTQGDNAELVRMAEKLLEWMPIYSKGSSGHIRQMNLRAAIDKLKAEPVEYPSSQDSGASCQICGKHIAHDIHNVSVYSYAHAYVPPVGSEVKPRTGEGS